MLRHRELLMPSGVERVNTCVLLMPPGVERVNTCSEAFFPVRVVPVVRLLFYYSVSDRCVSLLHPSTDSEHDQRNQSRTPE